MIKERHKIDKIPTYDIRLENNEKVKEYWKSI